MSVKVLAFFDARFQRRPSAGIGAEEAWRNVLVPPLGQFQPPVAMPSTLGTYDLADAAQAKRVVDAAKATGIGGFVVDCRRSVEGAYGRDADVFTPEVCGEDFELGFRWWNEASADAARQSADADAAVRAMASCATLRRQQRVVVVVNTAEQLADPAAFVAVVRAAAAADALPRLCLVANRTADPEGSLIRAGFDALVDPEPSAWHSCAPLAPPTGVDFFEVLAGLKDSALIADKGFSYRHFVNSRQMGRRLRGKALPRVFATFSDWPLHPYGGSTTLVSCELRTFRAFLEKSITWVAANFPADQQLVFLDSWNDRTTGTAVEPSTHAGDLVVNATRRAIDRGGYVVRTAASPAMVESHPGRADEVAALCRQAAAAIDAEMGSETAEQDDPTPALNVDVPTLAPVGASVPFSIVLPTAYGRMIVNRHDINQTGALLKSGESLDRDEIALLAKLLAGLPGDPVVIDVGANFGCFSLALAPLAGPHGQVHAFEAQRVIFNMLCGSVALNGLTNVHCHHVAVGDHEGRIEVPQFDYDKRMNFGSVEFGTMQRERLDQARGQDPRRREYVRLAALDSFRFERVDLLKIDAEGMELEVLAGAAETIGRCRPVIFAEYLKVSRRKLRAALAAHGYAVFRVGINYLGLPPGLQNLGIS
jgi:FkbM family methyltransferase